MKAPVKIVNAFSINAHGGNPAGIVLDTERLSSKEKQEVARKLGFPETAFVSPSDVADIKLEFFTPVRQIPHCGHATIATFSYLRQTGQIRNDHSSKETIDGVRKIIFKDGMPFMEQSSPRFTFLKGETAEIAASLNISEDVIVKGYVPTIVNTGNSFLLVPLGDEASVSKIRYDKGAVTEICKREGLIGYYVFTDKAADGDDASARMFGPYYGIDEEAATGMAAGPLACYLHQVMSTRKNRFTISQGRFMKDPSPSRILIEVETDASGTITRLFGGGTAHVAGERIIEL